MHFDEGPYAALILKEAIAGSPDRHGLVLPLTLAYLLSAHIRLLFPMMEEASRLIDSVFDGVLKKFYLESKGILYLKGMAPREIEELATGATLILTTDAQVARAARYHKLPYGFISQLGDQGSAVKFYGLEKVEAEELKQLLFGYVRLTNLGLGGFIKAGNTIHNSNERGGCEMLGRAPYDTTEMKDEVILTSSF